jgi:opacity protein-like surface antigen
MKTIQNTLLILAIAVAFASSVAFASCTQKMNFAKSNVVPAAEGYVKVKKDNNNNYDLTVTVENLAKPGDLTPARDVYVVWMQSERNELQKLGQIRVSSGLFGNSLDGQLNTTTTEEPERVFITAERDANVRNPIGETILTTKRRNGIF